MWKASQIERLSCFPAIIRLPLQKLKSNFMMKNLLFLFALFIAGASSYAQEANPLYIGYRNFTTVVDVVDTTGGPGSWTVTSTLSLSNDIGSSISGCYGLSINPLSQDMYILYQDGGGSTGRRIGILDTLTGFITDIGNVGNFTDITFGTDGTMYGTSGANVGRALYEINPSDATSTLLSTYSLGPTYSTGLCYDLYSTGTDRFWFSSQSPGYFAEIDAGTYTDVNLGITHPGWINACVSVGEDQFIAAGGSGTYLVDAAAGTSTNLSFFGPSGTIHAMSFGPQGISTIVDGPTEFCLNEPSTLAASDTASTYQWLLDDAPIAGATDSTYIPDASGDYSWIQNATDTSTSVTITVYPIPTADYTMDPNPLDLAVTTSGNVDFTNTSTDADTYHWDFDNGVTTSLSDPSLSFTDVGTYDVMLVAYDTVNGCSDTSIQTLTVINSVGISELSAEFKVYPVPTKDVVNISTNGIENDYIIELRDLNGRLISQQKAGMSSTIVSFDLSNFENGVYFINIFNDMEAGHFKVLKQ